MTARPDGAGRAANLAKLASTLWQGSVEERCADCKKLRRLRKPAALVDLVLKNLMRMSACKVRPCIAAGCIWSRLALDVKLMIQAIFESIEFHLKYGFKSNRTLNPMPEWDEEVGGAEGVKYIVAALMSRGVTEMHWSSTRDFLWRLACVRESIIRLP